MSFYKINKKMSSSTVPRKNMSVMKNVQNPCSGRGTRNVFHSYGSPSKANTLKLTRSLVVRDLSQIITLAASLSKARGHKCIDADTIKTAKRFFFARHRFLRTNNNENNTESSDDSLLEMEIDIQDLKDLDEEEDVNETKNPKEVKVSKKVEQPKETKKSKKSIQPKEPKEVAQPKESMEVEQPKETKKSKEPKQLKEPKKAAEPKEAKEPKQPKEQKEPKEPKQPKAPKQQPIESPSLNEETFITQNVGIKKKKKSNTTHDDGPITKKQKN